jgi:hypothetical protein
MSIRAAAGSRHPAPAAKRPGAPHGAGPTFFREGALPLAPAGLTPEYFGKEEAHTGGGGAPHTGD